MDKYIHTHGRKAKGTLSDPIGSGTEGARMKMIKRIAAIMIAGCLMMGLLCASFADETEEHIPDETTIANETPAGTADQVTEAGDPGVAPVPENDSA